MKRIINESKSECLRMEIERRKEIENGKSLSLIES
jgi:hypothetical protein